jgi:ATP-dependent Clp protease adaptor protein ClpS
MDGRRDISPITPPVSGPVAYTPNVGMRYPILVADDSTRSDTAVKERVQPKKQIPKQYKVLLLNDDYSTMDFVVEVLETIFQKSPAEAYRIMMQVHLNGSGLAGIYPWDIAETKVETVTERARSAGFPLRATIEEA